MELVKLSGVSKKIGANLVLDQIHFSQTKFQRVAVAGETGSGKSTLLKIMAGLDQPDEGIVLFEGLKVKGPADQLVPGHPAIAYLSQHFELPKFLRVEQVLSYANTLDAGAEELLYEVCRITHLLNRRTDELSGGERQRIALARLLSSSPQLLLLDEPYSNLDMVHKGILKEVVKDISEKLQITCLLVSHDPADTLSWADEIVVMKAGRFLQRATPYEIYTQPVDEYVAGLFGRYILLPPGVQKMLTAESGQIQKFWRPENFSVVPMSHTGVECQVIATHFFGGHWELEVRLMDHLLWVRTDADRFQPGDAVMVALANPVA